MSTSLKERIYSMGLLQAEAAILHQYEMRLITKAAYEALLLRVQTQYQLLIALDNTSGKKPVAYVSHFVGNGGAV
jgi:hypothetical protein